jgi:phage FluMu protein Com
MVIDKCPRCDDVIKLHIENTEGYWVHTGDKDPSCPMRNAVQ